MNKRRKMNIISSIHWSLFVHDEMFDKRSWLVRVADCFGKTNWK